MTREQSRSTQKEISIIRKSGFSLIEAILAVAVFSLLLTAFAGIFASGGQSSMLAGQRARAVFLAEEGLEAARNIRDAGFANLADGTHGLAVSGNQGTFSGSQDTSDIFTRQIVVSTVDAKRKSVTSNVTWQQNLQRTGSVALTTYLTNWTRVVAGQADGLVVDTTNANLAVGNKELRGITLENTGQTDIVIDKITVTWNNSNLIQNIKINNTNVWSNSGPGTPSGKQPSGTELDIQNFTLAQGSGVLPIDKFGFDGSMAGRIFTILFTLGDGTTKTVTVDFSGGGGQPTTCSEYCISLGNYVGGTCRKGNAQCNANGETMENGGNPLCIIQTEGGTCCCKP